MERMEGLERKNERIERRGKSESSGIGTLGLVGGIAGGIALLGLAALVIVTLPDIRRYIKISTM